MIKYFLFFLLFFTQIFPQSKSLLQSKIDKLLSDKFFESAQVAVDIYDLENQEILYQKNNKLLLHPASNMKLLTSAAGLIFLTPSYKFKTSLFYTGEIINETLYGDLYVVGGCDPDFTSDELDSLIDQLYLKVIKEISGNINADISMKDSLFWGNGWMWDDDPSTDAPYLSALNINNNSVGIAVKGKTAGEKGEIFLKPETNFINIINETKTSSVLQEDFLITRDWVNRTNTFTIKGNIKPDKSSLNENDFKYFNLFKPEDYFMTLFLEALYRKGIKTNNQFLYKIIPPNSEELLSFSRNIDTVIYNINKFSNNLSAEMMLYALAEKYYGKPATAENGLNLIDSLITLFNFNPGNYRFVDGSGVSHYNLVSAELLLNLLKYIYYYRKDLFLTFYNSLPVAGVDGTLKNRMIGTSAYNNVHAKTGTLSGVSALSGYVTNSKGNLIAFSIIIQNFVKSNSEARFFQDEICRILAEN